MKRSLIGLLILIVVIGLGACYLYFVKKAPPVKTTLNIQDKGENKCIKDSDCSYVWTVGSCNTPEYVAKMMKKNREQGIDQGEAPPRDNVTCTCENFLCVTHN